jgi:phage tail-like protein
MTAPGGGVITDDPIVARNFYLNIDSKTGVVLQSVSSLNLELTPVSSTQNGPGGKIQHVKTVGSNVNVPEVEMVRLAPRNAGSDPLWTWYKKIHKDGFKDRKDQRNDLTLELYDVSGVKCGMFVLHGAWPYKIVNDALSNDSNEPMKETITFVCEWIERTQ